MMRSDPSGGLQGKYIDGGNDPYRGASPPCAPAGPRCGLTSDSLRSAQAYRRRASLRSSEVSLFLEFGSQYNTDRIPFYPPVGYADIGVEVLIDTRRSPFLKPHGNESQSHDLECHLHGIAGWQGEHNEFKLVVDRDIALVNKFNDCLTDEHPVPVGWKVHHNKNMVKGPEGRWFLEDHEPDYDDGL
ncbi:hypothetical protein QYE76_054222 [Lolium multiflorum]|uniref:Phospholipase A1 n=1 Tax=Lolium multiflorum TaxID=4521 RepID=A0AAD8SZ06_LOLMU|nr:hypothetical protein QYE76_054222 [Lolium multiflorum]